MELSGSITKKLQGTETPPQKFLLFQEMELSSSIIKEFQGTETLKKISYILGNETF